LSLEELLDGFDSSDDFQSLMRVMDVQKEDLSRVFATIQHAKPPGRTCYFSENNVDQDHLSYMQFCEQLHRVQSRDMRMILLEITSVMYEVHAGLSEFKNEQTKHNSMSLAHHARLSTSIEAISEAMPKEMREMTETGSRQTESRRPRSPTLSAAALTPPRTMTPRGVRFGEASAEPETGDPMGALQSLPPEEPPATMPASRAPMLKSCGPSAAAAAAADLDTVRHLGLAEDLAGLFAEIEELRVRKAEVVKRLEGQVSTLSEHAEQVARCRDGALQKGTSGTATEDAALGAGGDISELDRLKEQVSQFRSNVNLRLRETLQAHRQNVEEEDDVLLSNSILAGALHGRMSIKGKPKPYRSEGRESRSEPDSLLGGPRPVVHASAPPSIGMTLSNMV